MKAPRKTLAQELADVAAKEARIDGGETFTALRKAGKLSLTPPRAGSGEGVRPLDDRYPYVAKRLVGLKGAESLKQVPVTRKGITMMAPLIENRQQEERFSKQFGFVRE